MEQKQGRKRELFEEKKKQWEVELEKLRIKLEDKYYKQFPHLMENDIISEPEPEVLSNGTQPFFLSPVQSSDPLSEIKPKADSRLSRTSKKTIVDKSQTSNLNFKNQSRDANESKLTKNGGDKSVHFSNTQSEVDFRSNSKLTDNISRKTPDMVKSNMKYKSAEKGSTYLSVPKTAPHRSRPRRKFIPFVENPELSQQENLRLKVEHFIKYN